MMNTRPAPRRPLPGSPFNRPAPVPPAETFAVSDLVTHDKYGLGTVLGVEEDVAVLVDFGQHKVRVAIPCSKLSKL